jgi:hypothetical protein
MSDYSIDMRPLWALIGIVLLACAAAIVFICYMLFSGVGSGSHEQGVRDALAGKYVVVQLPDGSSVVVENKEQGK